MTALPKHLPGVEPVGRTPSGHLSLRIDELVLHGFCPADRLSIAAAVERELARLLGEEGLPGQAGDRVLSTFRMDAGAIELPHDATPDAIGAQVAQAIYHGLDRAHAGGRAQGGQRR